MKTIDPTAEHRWLTQLIGDWTYEHEVPAHEGEPARTLRGVETFRAIGPLWVQGEASGPMPDGRPSSSLMTLGYDPGRHRFIGTWVGSMMPTLWIYDGELDDTGRKLQLYSEGPRMDGAAGTTSYKDVVELVSDTHRTLTGHTRDGDGTWRPFMTVAYHRR